MPTKKENLRVNDSLGVVLIKNNGERIEPKFPKITEDYLIKMLEGMNDVEELDKREES